MKRSGLTTPLSLIAMAVISNQAFAAEETGSNQDEFESITVVGQRTNSQITPQELEKYQANDLADVFRTIPSVSVGGSLGIAQKVYIRGVEDTLLNVTVDGAPQTGTLFHHVGRVSIDPELLNTVEVQAGAGEATAGAGAIGGAIRFKTKNIDDLLDGDQQFGGSIKANYFNNDGYKSSATLYSRLTDDWGLMGSYIYVDRDNMEDGNGDELIATGAEQSLGFIKLNGDLGNNQTLSISYESRREEGEFGARPNWPTLEGATLFPMEGKRKTFVLNYQADISPLLNLETSVYHTTSSLQQNRFDRWGLYGAEMKTWGFDIRNNSQLGNHSLTYGVEFRRDEVSSEYLAAASVWQKWAWDANTGQFKEKGDVTGFYIQDHWQLNDVLLVSFGLRYDQYDLTQVTYDNKTDTDGLSPNVGVRYQLNENWTIDLGYAEAMRGKEVGDAFTLEQEPGVKTIADDLKAEEVDNTELAITYEDEQWQITASIYQSDIENVIFDQLGRGVFYENIGKLSTDGYELKAAYVMDALRVHASYSHNDVDLNGHDVEGYEHIGLGNKRGDSWGANVSYMLSDSIELGWNFSYTEALKDVEVLQRGVAIGWIDQTQFIDKPGYQVHDIYLQWQPASAEGITVNLAVQNLFDKYYRDHSSVGDYNSIAGWEGVAGLYEAGRDIRLSVAYQF